MSFDQETYERLMLKQLDEQATPEEVSTLAAWLAASPDHQRQFEQVKSVWELTAHSLEIPPPNKAKAWNNVVEKARLRQAEDRASAPRQVQPSGRTSGWRRSRAWFAIPVVLALVLVWQLIPQSPSMIELTASSEGVQGFNLPDDTVIRLHEESTLQYAESFNKEDRVVYLDGDAYFNVTRTGLPFEVQIDGVSVQVLGTEFSVRSQETHTEVVVAEGQVRVTSSLGENQSIELGPGQGVRVTSTQLSPLAPETIQDAEDWINGSVQFDATAFPEAVTRLARIWNTQITISNPALEEETITGSIRVLPMMNTLETMCMTLETACSVRLEDGAYFIF